MQVSVRALAAHALGSVCGCSTLLPFRVRLHSVVEAHAEGKCALNAQEVKNKRRRRKKGRKGMKIRQRRMKRSRQ